MKVPFVSFDYQNQIIRRELINKITDVFDSGYYVLGSNIEMFEKKYSKVNRVKYSIGVGSGLDALTIALKALNIGFGDEVIVASNAYIASWLSISSVGAKIIPVEPDSDTFNIDPNLIEEKISLEGKKVICVPVFFAFPTTFNGALASPFLNSI